MATLEEAASYTEIAEAFKLKNKQEAEYLVRRTVRWLWRSQVSKSERYLGRKWGGRRD